MANKVVFYPLTKTIKINSGITSIDFKVDIYSDGKEDWLSTDFNKYKFPVRSIGGEIVTGGKVLEPTFFLMYGWQIEPASENHELSIFGNIFHDDSIPIVKVPSGSYSIIVNLSTTVSPDKINSDIVQQVSEAALYENRVYIDANSQNSGTVLPVGTKQYPVNNITDAQAIALARKNKLFLLSDLTITDIEPTDTLVIGSDNWKILTIESGLTGQCTFEKIYLYGEMCGVYDTLVNCWSGPLTNFAGWMEHTSIESVELAPYNEDSWGQSWFDSITSMEPNVPMEIIMNTNTDIIINDMWGKLIPRNMTEGSKVEINMSAGKLIIDESCSGGDIVIRGIGNIENNSSIIPTMDSFVNQENISEAVWCALTENHDMPGSFGEAIKFINAILRNKMVTDPVTGLLSVYDDDGVLLLQAQIYEDALGIQKYQGKGADRRERLV